MTHLSTKPVLLMTATVRPPPDALQLTRVDAALRMKDYCEAFSYYLSLLSRGVFSSIVFADNSNQDLSALKGLAVSQQLDSKVEFISFDGLDYPSSFGRGHGEFKLLDYAMAHSEIIAKSEPSAEIWKITGRYKVLNIDSILLTRPQLFDFWVHCRNHPLRWADMYLLGWRKSFYSENIRNVYKEFNDGALHTSAEVIFRDFVDQISIDKRVVQRMLPIPDLVGIRGVDSSSYEGQRWKFILRSLAARLLPWWWI